MEGQISEKLAKLDAMHVGFRSRYIVYEELEQQLKAWAQAFPEFVRLESIGQSRQGRELWLLILGKEPWRIRPALWVDGNMHASEVAGTSAALAVAEDIIRAHIAPDQPIFDIPPHITEMIARDLLVYVLPRMSPDGAELMLTEGAFVRSNPRHWFERKATPYFRSCDIDGDGQVRMMRRQDPAGDFIECPDNPNLMLLRRVEDPPPYYTLHPEGVIENWDGITLPPAAFLTSADTDLNRNFPFHWAPEPEQLGAGAFPTSEPESRAVTEFVSAHPHIFAWMNYHTYGGVFIRPPFEKPDSDMNAFDFHVYRQIAEWTESIAKYPMVSGFEDFCYEPKKPLRGDLSNFAYSQRGALSLVCELWDFWSRLGVKVMRPFADNYFKRNRDDALAMAKWDKEHNQGRGVGAWKACEHPQLGAVEVGGFDPRFGIWNPPPEELPRICEQQSRIVLRIGAMAPRLRISNIEIHRESENADLFSVSAVIENMGYLPTYGIASSKALPWNEPLTVALVAGEGVNVVTPKTSIGGRNEHAIGHLGGWGAFSAASCTPAFARSMGEAVRTRVDFTVRGKGLCTISASSPRMGKVEVCVQVG